MDPAYLESIILDLLGFAINGCFEMVSIPLSVNSYAEDVDWGKVISKWECSVISTAKQDGKLLCRKARWPNASPFAVFLSHDIDQIHDRELFRWLGDINHLRRHLQGIERAELSACIRRIIRPIVRPVDPFDQFASIRQIEGKHGWCSSFFLLEDKYWARMGGRFKWTDPKFMRISRFLLDEGCELGIHGSAYSHDDPQWWHDISSRFYSLYGEAPVGARNHYLKLSVPQTWQSQASAGLLYDSTYGLPDRIGAPNGLCFPFRVPLSQNQQQQNGLIELPMSVMDQTLFRYMNLDGDSAFSAASRELSKIIEVGGLAVLLWHNNFFNEPEYREWEETYERLLDWLAPQNPWVACGRDIAAWWDARLSASLIALGDVDSGKSWQLIAGKSLDNFSVEIFGTRVGDDVVSDVPFTEVQKDSDSIILNFPHLEAKETAIFRVRRT